MVFSSQVFLFAFLPLFLAVYFLLRNRTARNVCLLIASLLFYAWGEPVYVFLMVASIVANWGFGLAIPRVTRRRALLALAVAFNVLVIGFFKYEGFVANTINALAHAAVIPNLHLPLPIGISFFTLQALSYVIDVYRGRVESQRNILFFGMYVAAFPQLIAGPIVRYRDIELQIRDRRETLADFSQGIRIFIIGLSKKVLLANTMAILATKMLESGAPAIGFIGTWAGLFAWTFQIYFDFSGYSDMAIGLGRMMGFKYLRNFNYPFISRSMAEFWRRWHISLMGFFRDYLYIPLGGSRCSNRRWLFNILVVWLITGLWHGAAWNYAAWGLWWALIVVCEKFVWGRAIARAPRVIQSAYVVLANLLSWLLFWVAEPSKIVRWAAGMVGHYGLTGSHTLWETTVWEYWPVFVICIIASLPVLPWLKARLAAWVEGRAYDPSQLEAAIGVRATATDDLCAFAPEPATQGRATAATAIRAARDLALLALFAASCVQVVSGAFNPFIYFQF